MRGLVVVTGAPSQCDRFSGWLHRVCVVPHDDKGDPRVEDKLVPVLLGEASSPAPFDVYDACEEADVVIVHDRGDRETHPFDQQHCADLCTCAVSLRVVVVVLVSGTPTSALLHAADVVLRCAADGVHVEKDRAGVLPFSVLVPPTLMVL